MLKAMIADDEEWTVFGLKKLVNWEESGFSVAATAPDGITALSLATDLQPDLLLTDIRMPGLSGLELLKSVREKRPMTVIVMVTAYSDFSYAQDALRNGAFDYLVKPVEKNRLLETLTKAKEKAAEIRREAISRLLPLLSDRKNKMTVKELFDKLHFRMDNLTNCRFLAAAFSERNQAEQAMATDNTKYIGFQSGENSCVFILPADNKNTNISYLDLTANSICAGISDVLPLSATVRKGIEQADNAMRTAALHNSHDICTFCGNGENQISRQLITDFIIAIRQKDSTGMLNILDKLDSSSMSMTFSQFAECVNQIIFLLRQYAFGNCDTLTPMDSRFADLSNLPCNITDTLRLCITSDSTPTPAASTPVSRILDSIDENFTRDIRIDDISKEFYISSNYLSILIKRETGYSFTDLLIKKRINLAKKLLTETDLPIQDIVEKVGYKDYSGFIKLFKKVTGVTPFAYRRGKSGS